MLACLCLFCLCLASCPAARLPRDLPKDLVRAARRPRDLLPKDLARDLMKAARRPRDLARDLPGDRMSRDLIYENMVMRNKYNSTTRDKERKPFVGGGILERKVIAAKNGTENRHEESREMECCSKVRVTGASNGGVMDTTVECHPYAMGLYTKIGVCGGRSIYQHANNTDIFMYYGCGRWFIGLEIGVCGGWLFSKSMSICVHGQHEGDWQVTSDLGLVGDRSLRVEQGCQEEFSPKPIGADNLFRPYHDYIDRTQYSPAKTASPTRPPSIQEYGGQFGQGLGQASYDQLELLY